MQTLKIPIKSTFGTSNMFVLWIY